MSYVNVVVLPRPHNMEFKCVGKLIFDINYVVTYDTTTRYWYNSKEQSHREDGPAIIWESRGGDRWWCRYGKHHREDGPAIFRSGGAHHWCLNGGHYSEEDFNEEMRRRNELRKSKNLTETT